jgi:hypothetical protein
MSREVDVKGSAGLEQLVRGSSATRERLDVV